MKRVRSVFILRRPHAALARECNEKLEMIGDDRSGLYLFDRDIIVAGAKSRS
ncbi:hypothetical protein [Flavihumibacter fluvii]|uniref:hypothetical protein n=1 Tax=Flavihumibacter fluvii TaxID=2838157 RepID=UPI001BDE2021|nr:hypothetical protein [Flavihumibacter fluvii]ULQ52117.1 hypothetical protein KJS93_18650 [Flavihumibacter fluvii]